MRSVTDSMRCVCSLALAAAILSPLPLAAETRVRQVKWEDLSIVTGHTVRISLPGGSITGKAGTVEADALVVDIREPNSRTGEEVCVSGGQLRGSAVDRRRNPAVDASRNLQLFRRR